jgi:hypothetical protein
MVRRYSQIDPWFLQRGYKRTGTRECYYWLRQGDLLFRLSITASPSKYDHTKWTTLITYFASLPKFGKLHVELLQNSSFSVPPTGANSKLKGAFAMSRNYVAGQRGFPWVRHFLHLENETIGPAWRSLLRQFDHDLPIAWADLSVADDLYEQMFQSKYWAWYGASHEQLFTLLHQQRWDDALEHVHSWTEKDINIRRLDEEPGKWTAQEELDNAIRVVKEYVDKHRKD